MIILPYDHLVLLQWFSRSSSAHSSHTDLEYMLQVGDEYRSMAGVIGQSKKLITKYARREFTDKVSGKPNQVSPIYFIL